jgi:hypothetical protein
MPETSTVVRKRAGARLIPKADGTCEVRCACGSLAGILGPNGYETVCGRCGSLLILTNDQLVILQIGEIRRDQMTLAKYLMAMTTQSATAN